MESIGIRPARMLVQAESNSRAVRLGFGLVAGTTIGCAYFMERCNEFAWGVNRRATGRTKEQVKSGRVCRGLRWGAITVGRPSPMGGTATSAVDRRVCRRGCLFAGDRSRRAWLLCRSLVRPGLRWRACQRCARLEFYY